MQQVELVYYHSYPNFWQNSTTSIKFHRSAPQEVASQGVFAHQVYTHLNRFFSYRLMLELHVHLFGHNSANFQSNRQIWLKFHIQHLLYHPFPQSQTQASRTRQAVQRLETVLLRSKSMLSKNNKVGIKTQETSCFTQSAHFDIH